LPEDRLQRRRWERPRLIAAAVAGAVCSVLILTSGCGAGEAGDPDAATATTDSKSVSRGTLQSRLLLSGELQAVESAKIIVPRTPSWQMPIRWIEADGAAVVAGQRVVELDNTGFSGDLEQNRLAESSALNDLMRKEADIAVDLADREYRLEEARIRLEKARIEADVPEQLRSRREHQEKQLALARAEVEMEKARDELETGRAAAESELEELRLALERAGSQVRIAEEAIEALTLRAPRDGILVVSENPREGRKFQTGDNAWVGLAVASIPELSSMQVVARLSDVDDGKIAPGMRAVCVLDTYPDESYTGRVTEITPIAKEQGRNSQRRAFRVRIDLDETDPSRMRPGMSVMVDVQPRAREDVLLVPRRSVDFSGDAPRVKLASGGLTEVTLGPCNATHCVVEDGLEAGQRLGVAG